MLMFSRAHRTSLCESTCLFPGSFSSSSEVRTGRSFVWGPLVMREGLWEAARGIHLSFEGTNPCKNWEQNIWQWLDSRKNYQKKLPRGLCPDDLKLWLQPHRCEQHCDGKDWHMTCNNDTIYGVFLTSGSYAWLPEVLEGNTWHTLKCLLGLCSQ